MQVKTIYKGLCATALGAALSFGASFQASALPVFTVNPAALGSTQPVFNADHFTGNASSLVNYNSATNTITGQGYFQFSGFYLNTNLVPRTGLGNDYGMYATFNYTATLTSGSFGTADSTYTINTLSYGLFGYNYSSGTQPVFTEANAATNSGGTVAPGTASRQIGSGGLIVGTISQNEQAGTTVTTTDTYANTPFGSTFFIAPVPFYNISFVSTTNNTSGITVVGNTLSINAASSSVDFGVNRIPEPGSLALIGLGLVGLFATNRRRKSV